MKATYLATILLSATLSLGAPTGLNDIISSQNTISPLSNPSSNTPPNPINQISSVLTPAPSNPNSKSTFRPNDNTPARPEEYLSGALREHKTHNKRLDMPLSDLTNSNSAVNASNLLDPITGKLDQNNNKDHGLKGVSDTLSNIQNGMGGIGGKKRISKRDIDFVEMAQDHLGRKVVRRGNDFQIQEPADQGRQWGGASELDDENDEPFWG